MKKCHKNTILLLILGFVSCSKGTTIFVDNQLIGDCTSGEYSIANRDNSGSDGIAYNTIQEAVNVTTAGDTVVIRTGTYTPSARVLVQNKTGTSSAAKIEVTNYNSEQVILDATNIPASTYYGAVTIQNSNYIVLSGFTICNYPHEDGVSVYNSNYVELYNLIVASNNRMGIHIVTSDHFNISNCTIYNNMYKGIWIHGSSYGTVDRNEVYGNCLGIHVTKQGNPQVFATYNTISNNLVYNNIINPEGADGISVSSGTSNNVISLNVAYGNADDGIDSSTQNSPGMVNINETIINNIVFNNGDGPDGAGDGNGIKVSTNNGGGHIIANNVSFGNERCGFDQDKAIGYPKNFFYNNIAYGNGKGGFFMDAPSLPQDEDAVLYNNVAFNNSIADLRKSNDLAVNDSDYNFWGDGDFVSGMDEHSLSGDPLLSNPGFVVDTNFVPEWSIDVKLNYIRSQVKAAFSPLEGSPLIDAGVVIDGYHNLTAGSDAGSGKIWYGNAPDIGPFEFVPSNDPNLHHVLSISSSGGGSVTNPGEGSYQHSEGDVVSLQAQAGAGYQFVNWTGTAVDAGKVVSQSSASTTVTVDADCTIQANFAVGPPPKLTISSTSGGAVTTPGTGTYAYTYGTDVPIEVSPAANYHFVNWTGTAVSAGKVADPNSSNTTVTMDADYTLAANFAIDQHNLTTSSTAGGSVTTPGEGTYAYDHGASASVVAAPSANYSFVNWTGTAVDAGKVANANSASTTVTMDAAYSIQANFALDQHTMTISSTSGGSVSNPGEGSFQYDYGTNVPIQASPANNSYFVNWTGSAVNAGKVANPNSASTSVIVDAAYTIQANFAPPDGNAPTITNLSPASGAIQAPLDSLIILHVTDAGIGVDAGSVQIKLNDLVIYIGDVASYDSASGICRRTGTLADYTYAFQADQSFDFDELETVTVNASDLGGAVMGEQSYSFRTEMRSFGDNKQVSSGLDGLDSATAATKCDSSGNIWAVWHAGPVGSRDIYVGKLTAGASNFSTSVRITVDGADQANPAVALGTDNKLYVVWQDNRRGNWDIYGSVSTNGTDWSAPQRIADADEKQSFNQINPVVAVGNQSPNHVYVGWQDDRSGNYDIYIAESSNAFAMNTIVQVTSDPAAQTQPAIAVDSSNTVYLLWTDARNTANGTDIYGATGNSWTNVPVVSKAADQSSPAIGVESSGSILHILWADQSTGNGDIYYASSNGFPGTPLTGSNLVDDASGAAQISPSIVVTGTGDSLNVFACWRDERNVSGGTGDTDIYMVQADSSSGTNIFVGDGGTNSDQIEPSIGIDQSGYPYIVWGDNRGTNTGIYYAGSTYRETTALESSLISASSGGTLGPADVQSIASVDDVSIALPAGACPYDATISVAKIENPHDSTLPFLNGYDFSPSGIEFNTPVTITLPYAVSSESGTPTPYWYNALTGTLSQQGIDNIEIIELNTNLHALRFTTTHLTPYYVLMGSDAVDSSGGGLGAGAAGCMLSNSSRKGDILDYFLPYIALGLFMVALRLKDRRRIQGAK